MSKLIASKRGTFFKTQCIDTASAAECTRIVAQSVNVSAFRVTVT